MGIGGLLPFLKSIQRPVQLRDYAGQTIGVDGYVWLHRGANQCAPELVFGIPTRKYVQYFLDMVRLLMNHSITPIIVFDGGRLPSKLRTEEDRHQKRAEARAKYEEHLQKGDREKANAALKGIVEVTPLMAYEVIKELRKLDVEFYVAPYEADSQLAFFDRTGVTTATITEDSDLLTYGCSRVIYKLKFDSKPIEIRRDDIFTIKDLRHWNMTKFREMCILSGCDYLASPEGIGLAKAKKALLNTRAESVLKNWESFPNMPGNAKLVKGYRKKFMLANYTFLHQRVYDPSLGRLVPLHPFPPDMEISDELSFVIGSDLPPDLARAIAEGHCDPETYAPFEPDFPVTWPLKEADAATQTMQQPSVRSASTATPIAHKRPLSSFGFHPQISSHVERSPFKQLPNGQASASASASGHGRMPNKTATPHVATTSSHFNAENMRPVAMHLSRSSSSSSSLPNAAAAAATTSVPLSSQRHPSQQSGNFNAPLSSSPLDSPASLSNKKQRADHWQPHASYHRSDSSQPSPSTPSLMEFPSLLAQPMKPLRLSPSILHSSQRQPLGDFLLARTPSRQPLSDTRLDQSAAMHTPAFATPTGPPSRSHTLHTMTASRSAPSAIPASGFSFGQQDQPPQQEQSVTQDSHTRINGRFLDQNTPQPQQQQQQKLDQELDAQKSVSATPTRKLAQSNSSSSSSSNSNLNRPSDTSAPLSLPLSTTHTSTTPGMRVMRVSNGSVQRPQMVKVTDAVSPFFLPTASSLSTKANTDSKACNDTASPSGVSGSGAEPAAKTTMLPATPRIAKETSGLPIRLSMLRNGLATSRLRVTLTAKPAMATTPAATLSLSTRNDGHVHHEEKPTHATVADLSGAPGVSVVVDASEGRGDAPVDRQTLEVQPATGCDAGQQEQQKQQEQQSSHRGDAQIDQPGPPAANTVRHVLSAQSARSGSLSSLFSYKGIGTTSTGAGASTGTGIGGPISSSAAGSTTRKRLGTGRMRVAGAGSASSMASSSPSASSSSSSAAAHGSKTSHSNSTSTTSAFFRSLR